MGEWKRVKLGDCIKEINEKTTENNQYQVLSVTKDGIFSQEEYFKKQIASENNIGYKILKRNNLVFSTMNLWMGSLDVLTNYDIGIVSPSYKIFEFNKELMLPEYGNYFMRSYYMIEQYKNCSEQGASIVRRNLDLKALLNVEIMLPIIKEQEKIVIILENIDKIIEKYMDKKEIIEREKEYIIRKIFDKNILKIDHKGKIKDIMTFEGGSQPDKKYFSNHKSDEYIRLIQIRDYRSSEYVTYIPRSMARRYCKKDDVMIGRYGPPIFQILRGLEGAYNVALIKAIPKENSTKDFVYYVLKQRRLFDKIDWLSQRTSGQTGIDMEFLNNYNVIIPTIEYQNKVSKILKLYDCKIDKIEDKCQVYKNLKKGLMQKLLTGKIRVKI